MNSPVKQIAATPQGSTVPPVQIPVLTSTFATNRHSSLHIGISSKSSNTTMIDLNRNLII